MNTLLQAFHLHQRHQGLTQACYQWHQEEPGSPSSQSSEALWNPNS